MVDLREILDMYFNGELGETLFYQPFARSLQDREGWALLSKAREAGDERSMVLVSAMVCEEYIDQLLAILLPRYSRLSDDAGNFTFSTKIKLLESFEIVPLDLTRAADLLRRVRNEFAHNLNVSSFADVDPKIIQKLRGMYDKRKIRTDIGPNDLPNLFYVISDLATRSLFSYRVSLRYFATEIRRPEFLAKLVAGHLQDQDAILKELRAGVPQKS